MNICEKQNVIKIAFIFDDIEEMFELIGVIRLHFSKTENIQPWLHLAVLHL